MNRRSGSPEQPTPVHDTGTDSSTAPEARALGPSGIDRLADLLPVMVALNDEQGNGVFLNARVHDYLGLEPGATTTSWREHIHPEDRETAGKVWRDGLRSGKAFRNSFRLWHAASGDYRWNQGETVPLRAPNGGLLRWLSVLTDVHDRRLAELETQQQAARQQILARQQSALAKLGLHALEDYALPALMAQASRVVADLLDVEFCKILRLLPSGDELLLEAGVGWRKGLIGTTTISAGEGSQAGYAIECDGPVLEQDLRTETRFTSSPLLLDHDVISGISVVIRTPAGPYGVLGAHSRQKR
ncbi:MAG TPA: PAS domain-containing protein, partial [Trueperaceae bacterium]